MPRPNHLAALPPLVLATLLTAACNHYPGPRGPGAQVPLELYSGDWMLDADESDPGPDMIHSPLKISPGPVVSGSAHGGPTLEPPPCPQGQICRDRTKSPEGARSESSSPVADPELSQTHLSVAVSRPPRLTLQLTESVIRVSPSGLGIPLEVPMDPRKTEVDHEFGDFAVKAWSRWEGESLSLVISVGDDESWVSDTYELHGDGTLVVTRELGGGYFFPTLEPLRFVYRRPATPAP